MFGSSDVTEMPNTECSCSKDSVQGYFTFHDLVASNLPQTLHKLSKTSECSMLLMMVGNVL